MAIGSNYIHLLKERKADYNTWIPVFCSALREYVFFTTRGFNHLRFHTDNTPRNPKEAMYKIGLLPLVRPVVHKATKVKSYEKRLAPVGGSRKKVLKEMEYWALIEVVGQNQAKVKIVLRRIGNGQVHFWSVMKLGENQNSPA